MTKTLSILAAGAFALCTGMASAGTVTFDFTAGPTTNFMNNLSYSNGGLNLNLTAATYDVAGSSVTLNGAKPLVVKQQASAGLASQFNCKKGVCDDNFRTDGSQFNELLQFSFNKIATITAITFNPRGLDSNDFFDFAVDGKLGFSGLSAASYNIAQDFTGHLFGIGASADTSAFRVTSITVAFGADAAPVPVPAAGVMALGGLGALLAARRKAKRA